jgi:hypothetical protein
MARWCTFAALLLLAGLPLSASAQGDAWAPPGGVVPAGWHTHAGHAPAAAYGHVSPAAYGPPGPFAYGPGRTVYEELPDDKGWLYEDPPIDRILKEVFRHAYFRADYLLWDITDPGENLLGAPTNFAFALPNPRVPFQITNPSDGTILDVVEPSLLGVETNENNGIRGTVGFTSGRWGTFEASVFALETASHLITPPVVNGFTTIDADGDGVPDVDANGNIISASENIIDAMVQATLVDGVVPNGNNFTIIWGVQDPTTGLFSPSYEAVLKTQLFGAEGNWIQTPLDVNAPLVLSPMFGIRYLKFGEQLNQRGQYTFTEINPISGLETTQNVDRRIDSSAINHVYGPQIGLQAELNNRWFSIGVQPKVMLGFNSYNTQLSTLNILSPRDPAQDLQEKRTTFGVIGDLQVNTRLHVTPRFSLVAAYNLMWTGLVTRPGDNTIYNIQRSPAQSGFALDPQFSSIMIQGLSVGGELRY